MNISEDASIGFDDLRQLLLRLGFEERVRGSHHSFRKEGIEEKVNLQREAAEIAERAVRAERYAAGTAHVGELRN